MCNPPIEKSYSLIAILYSLNGKMNAIIHNLKGSGKLFASHLYCRSSKQKKKTEIKVLAYHRGISWKYLQISYVHDDSKSIKFQSTRSINTSVRTNMKRGYHFGSGSLVRLGRERHLTREVVITSSDATAILRGKLSFPARSQRHLAREVVVSIPTNSKIRNR